MDQPVGGEQIRHYLNRQEQTYLLMHGESVIHKSRPGEVIHSMDRLPAVAEIESSPYVLAQHRRSLDKIIQDAQAERAQIDKVIGGKRRAAPAKATGEEARFVTAPPPAQQRTTVRPVSPPSHDDTEFGDYDEDTLDELGGAEPLAPAATLTPPPAVTAPVKLTEAEKKQIAADKRAARRRQSPDNTALNERDESQELAPLAPGQSAGAEDDEDGEEDGEEDEDEETAED